jgi:5-hydroxyisourate hydrolase
VSAVSAISTHVLDTAAGRPAQGVAVRLEQVSAAGPAEIGRARTDADGRASDLGPDTLRPGIYRLVFDTGEYFAARQAAQPGTGGSLFPEVIVTVRVDDPAQHLHVPLLLSPFSYSTYRGS